MAEQQAKPIAARASDSNNAVVKLMDSLVGDRERTVYLTGVDPDSQHNPWNPDELYRKRGDYSVYEDMLKDDQVSVAMNVKKDLIIGSGWHIKTEEDDQADMKKELEIALTEDIETSFEDCLAQIITAYDVGFSVTEKQFKQSKTGGITLKNLKTRNPVSWLFHQDKYGNIVKYEQMGATEEFADIPKESLIHFINNPRYGNPYGSSDLRSAYAAYVIKTHITRFYSIFLEKAASPTPIAKYERGTAQDEEITKIHNTIKRLQTSTAMTIPKDFDVEFLEASSNGEAFIRGINMFNMFIGRALFVPDLLGFQGGETTGGSQALGREQMVVFFKHIMRRRRSLENAINLHVIKPILTWNYGVLENYPKFKLNPIEEEQAENNAKLWLEAVKSRVWAPTAEEINHFKGIVNFPESTDDELLEVDPIEEAADKVEDPEHEDEKEAKPDADVSDKSDGSDKFAKTYDFPKGDYHRKTNFKAIEKQLDGNLDLFLAKATPLVKAVFQKFAERLKKKNLTASSAKLEKLDSIALPKAEVRRVEKLCDEMLTQTFKSAVDLASGELIKNKFSLSAEEFLKALEEENYNFIGDWSYQITKRARTEIIAAVKDGKPISSVIDFLISEGIDEANITLERYARTKFTEVMNKGRLEYFNGTGVVGAYQYAAVLDDRTSEICEGLHGKIFRAGEAPVPPNHFGCRSILIPITNYEEWEPDTKVGSKNIEDFISENLGKGFPRY